MEWNGMEWNGKRDYPVLLSMIHTEKESSRLGVPPPLSADH